MDACRVATVASSEPSIVSVDDHVIEPPHTWESRLPATLRDRGPRAFDGPNGVYWEFNGERLGTDVAAACVGIPLEDRSGPYRWDGIRRGCYDPVERVKDMDADGIVASLCFPSLPGFGGTKFNCLDDRDLGMACIRAYNDFQTDEWAGSAPGRLFGMVLLPYWDTKLAVQELQRSAAKGAVAVAFSENPYRQGYPSIHDKERYWDPVFAAAQEAEMPLCMHFGSSSFVIDTTSPDAPRIVHTVSTPLNSMSALIDWLLSGVFERFPGLQVVFSESYIGWIPFIVQHADRHWTRHFAWTHDRKMLPRLPSEYFHQNVSVCLVYEDIDARQLEQTGINRVLAEADYPHSDSLWPNTRSVLEGYLKDLSPEDRMKVLRTNADQLFHLNLG
jgi:predicted TIM-barrel fold metal-dependent hydrolase